MPVILNENSIVYEWLGMLKVLTCIVFQICCIYLFL